MPGTKHPRPPGSDSAPFFLLLGVKCVVLYLVYLFSENTKGHDPGLVGSAGNVIPTPLLVFLLKKKNRIKRRIMYSGVPHTRCVLIRVHVVFCSLGYSSNMIISRVRIFLLLCVFVFFCRPIYSGRRSTLFGTNGRTSWGWSHSRRPSIYSLHAHTFASALCVCFFIILFNSSITFLWHARKGVGGQKLFQTFTSTPSQTHTHTHNHNHTYTRVRAPLGCAWHAPVGSQNNHACACLNCCRWKA